MIHYVSGDLVASATLFDAIAHGCNAQGVMGSGIAKQIRDKFPQVYEAYKRAHSKHGLNPGECVRVKGNSPTLSLQVMNLITQQHYGRSGRYASPEAIRKSLNTALSSLAFDFRPKVPTIGLPLIGCGLGGLDWEQEVRPIYEDLSEAHDVDMYVFESFVAGKVVEPSS